MAAWTVLAPKDRGRSAAPIGAHPRSSSAASGHLLWVRQRVSSGEHPPDAPREPSRDHPIPPLNVPPGYVPARGIQPAHDGADESGHSTFHGTKPNATNATQHRAGTARLRHVSPASAVAPERAVSRTPPGGRGWLLASPPERMPNPA